MLHRKTLAVLLVALFVLTLLPASALAAATLPEGVTEDSFEGANTVYYNGDYYETLTAALNAVYKSRPTETAIVYCKPDSDVGVMTHGHVADDLIIYGNGARVSGGEYDLEIDTYQYDRTTGKQSNDGAFLTGDIRVEVHDLDGIAAWGQRNTAHTIDLVFTNCRNMNRIYFTNTVNKEGSINVTLNNCSFDANEGSNANTSVYSNAPGTIAITDTTFTGIAVGLNINHKSAGVQNITLTNCTFTDCALKDSAQAASTRTYGAPVRVVAAEGAETNLTVTNAQFVYSEGKSNVGNGDILIGDGRYDAAATQGVVTLAMTETQAQVMVQKAKYYTDANGNDPVNAANMAVTPVQKTDVLEANADSHFVVKAPQQPQEPEVKPDVPETGDRGILLWAATLVTLGGVCAGLVLRRRNAVVKK